MPLPKLSWPSLAATHTDSGLGSFGLLMRVLARTGAAALAGVWLAGLLGAAMPRLDNINHFQSLVAIAALGLLAVAWWVEERDDRVWYALIAAIHAMMFLAPAIRWPERLAGSLQGEPMKVMTFNYFYYQQRHADVEAFIRSVSPDVLVFQEVAGRNAEMLNARLSDLYPHRRFCRLCDVALLSKRPWVEIREYPHDMFDTPPLIVATYEGPGGRPLHVAGVHLFNPSDPQRQHRELGRLVQVLSALPGSKILAGDLNLTPWTWAYNRLAATLAMRDNGMLLGTWSASRTHVQPWFPIDHIMATHDIAIVAAERGPRLGSDHLPVIATLRLPKS